MDGHIGGLAPKGQAGLFLGNANPPLAIGFLSAVATWAWNRRVEKQKTAGAPAEE
jgi:hypothetical protein